MADEEYIWGNRRREGRYRRGRPRRSGSYEEDRGDYGGYYGRSIYDMTGTARESGDWARSGPERRGSEAYNRGTDYGGERSHVYGRGVEPLEDEYRRGIEAGGNRVRATGVYEPRSRVNWGGPERSDRPDRDFDAGTGGGYYSEGGQDAEGYGRTHRADVDLYGGGPRYGGDYDTSGARAYTATGYTGVYGGFLTGSYGPFAGSEERGYRGKGPKGYRRSDGRISEDVSDRLTDDPHLDASEIEVKVEDGVVTLTGTVNTRQEKRRAEDVAERVAGVKDVQNELRLSRAS